MNIMGKNGKGKKKNQENGNGKVKAVGSNIKKIPKQIASKFAPLTAELEEQRHALPITSCRKRILEEVKKSDVLLLMGETGAGKTTQIPQFLLEAGFGVKGMIAVTQPLRIAAITTARRVAQEQNCQLGDLVGYTVRFEDCASQKTRIRFISDDCLLREAVADRLLKNYSAIMLDEAHQRTASTDVLFGVIKEAQRQRNLCSLMPLKVIIISATMDIDHFERYFDVKGMYVEGRTYPVKVMHAKETNPDYLHATLVTLFNIHQNTPIE